MGESSSASLRCAAASARGSMSVPTTNVAPCLRATAAVSDSVVAPAEQFAASVVVTPADIAAAAQAAGLKPQSLKLALMHRPGCRMTPDGGAAVAAA